MKIDPALVVDALRNDHSFSFKTETTKYLQQGTCPDCNKKEVSISIENPWRVFCNRINKCGYEETTRNLYPDLWEDLNKLAPTTETDPNATARYYLANVRGFNTAKLHGCYHQTIRKIKTINGDYINVDVCRFPLWDNHYQDRVINTKDLQRIDPKKKAPFSYGFEYRHRAWTPANFTLNNDDTCFIVEGIFHALALIEIGQNAIASFSSNNFPEKVINAHQDKNITWVIGFDDDPAGHKAINKAKKQLTAMGEEYRIALTGSGADWDDLLRQKKLDDKFIEDSLWRGDVFNASSIEEKAYYIYLRNNKPNFITDFKNRTYRLKLDTEDFNEALDHIIEIDDSIEFSPQALAVKRLDGLLTEEGKNTFIKLIDSLVIAECHPVFLYSETDKFTNDIAYFFEINSPNVSTRQIALSGGAIDSPSSFNSALLSRVPSAAFDGSAQQLKQIRSNWFRRGVDEIQTVPFLGYDKDSGFYLFPNFAYKKGRKIPVNKHNYIKHGKHMIKTTFKAYPVVEGEPFKPTWINDFIKTFNANGLTTLSFWLGSLFAEQIRAKHSSYPFLEMSGQPGTGKSTLLEFMWKCTGRDDYEGFDASKATFSGRAKTFIQAANIPVVLIESDREKDSKKGAFDYNELKTAYNGRAVRTMGAFTKGNETIEPTFKGSIILAQNDEIDASKAVLERIVHLNFTKAHFTPETKRLSSQLSKMRCESLAGFFQAVLEKESEILDHFFTVFSTIETQYTNNGKLKNGRIIQNHAQIAAMGHCLPLLFPQITNDHLTKLTDFIESRGVQRERRLVSDHPLVQQFWENYELLEESPSTRINHSKNPEVIAIRLVEFHQECQKNQCPRINEVEIKTLLKSGTTHKFIGQKAVDSAITNKSVRCWVFDS